MRYAPRVCKLCIHYYMDTKGNSTCQNRDVVQLIVRPDNRCKLFTRDLDMYRLRNEMIRSNKE